MKVQAMLAGKGDKVVTTRPDTTIATVIGILKLERIGALVVSEDGERVLGIISERDIVRKLASHDLEVLSLHAEALMTRNVKTCKPADNIKAPREERARNARPPEGTLPQAKARPGPRRLGLHRRRDLPRRLVRADKTRQRGLYFAALGGGLGRGGDAVPLAV